MQEKPLIVNNDLTGMNEAVQAVSDFLNRPENKGTNKKRCEYEMFVEKYFGLTEIPASEDYRITTDYGNLVSMLAMFDETKNK